MKVVIVLSVVLALCTVVRGGNEQDQFFKKALAIKNDVVNLLLDSDDIAKIASSLAAKNIQINLDANSEKAMTQILNPLVNTGIYLYASFYKLVTGPGLAAVITEIFSQ